MDRKIAMTDKMTALPARCDDNYKDALKRLGRQKNKPVGDLVRDAIDQVYGGDLKPLLAFFRTQNGDLNQQMDSNITNKD